MWRATLLLIVGAYRAGFLLRFLLGERLRLLSMCCMSVPLCFRRSVSVRRTRRALSSASFLANSAISSSERDRRYVLPSSMEYFWSSLLCKSAYLRSNTRFFSPSQQDKFTTPRYRLVPSSVCFSSRSSKDKVHPSGTSLLSRVFAPNLIFNFPA